MDAPAKESYGGVEEDGGRNPIVLIGARIFVGSGSWSSISHGRRGYMGVVTKVTGLTKLSLSFSHHPLWHMARGKWNEGVTMSGQV